MGKNQYDYNNYISSELIFQGGVLLENAGRQLIPTSDCPQNNGAFASFRLSFILLSFLSVF